LGLEEPQLLAIDFYRFPSVGHSLINALWATENNASPGYWRPVLDWSPSDSAQVPSWQQDASAVNHYLRTMGMWYPLLHKAGFTAPPGLAAQITFTANVKTDLTQNVEGVATDPNGRFREGHQPNSQVGQPVTALGRIYQRVAALHRQHGNARDWFPDSQQDGSPYFND